MAEQRLIGLWTDCFNIVIDLLETSRYLFFNFKLIIWFFLYLPLMPRGHACGRHNAHGAVSGTWRKRPRFHFKFRPSAQKRESKKRAWESLASPLRSQNAIPAPYIKLSQKGSDNCDTKRIHSVPVD